LHCSQQIISGLFFYPFWVTGEWWQVNETIRTDPVGEWWQVNETIRKDPVGEWWQVNETIRTDPMGEWWQVNETIQTDPIGEWWQVNETTRTDPINLPQGGPHAFNKLSFESANGDPVQQFKSLSGDSSKTMPEPGKRRYNLLATLHLNNNVILMSAKQMFQKVPVFFDRVNSTSAGIFVDYFLGTTIHSFCHIHPII